MGEENGINDRRIKARVRVSWLSGVEKGGNKKFSYCWETVRRESIPRIAEMDVEMTT